MLLAAHSLAGAAAGDIINNPVLAFLLGIVIHFCLDAVPHYDTTDRGVFTARQIILAAADFFIGCLILFNLKSLYSSHLWSTLAGAAGGIFPDVLNNFPPFKRGLLKTRVGNLFFDFHKKVHRTDLPFLPGIAIQICVWLAATYIIARYAL